MLEMVQHASFRMDSLALLRRCSRHGRAEQFSTTCDARTDLLVTGSSGKCEVDLCRPRGGCWPQRSARRVLLLLSPVFECHLQWRCFRRLSVRARRPCSRCACRKEAVKLVVVRSKLRRGARPRLHEQLHQAPADAGVDDGLDLVVGAVREIRQSPASVRQQVWVAAEQKPGQHRQAGRHLKRARNLGATETGWL